MGSRVCENDDSPVHREFAFGVDDATSVESHFGWLCQVCADGGARDPGPRGFCAILGIDTEDTFFSRVAQGIADGDALLVRLPRECIRVYPGVVSRE